MKSALGFCFALGLILIITVAPCFSDEPNMASTKSSKYLDAVREFAENVLKYGRDTYGPKHTPLFADGLNIYTHEPVKWISYMGSWSTATECKEWIICNFASQQTLLRTLDGLTTLTGDPKYRDAAMEVTKYAFENLRAPNGLFYWGRRSAYDLQADQAYHNFEMHSVKRHYPYYELMWKVDPEATSSLIEDFWSAHVVNWSNLDFDRIARYPNPLERPWQGEYLRYPTFFETKVGNGLGQFHTATSLVHAGTTLHRLSGQQQPFVWSKRLIERFADARHMATGISPLCYNRPRTWEVPNKKLTEHYTDRHTVLFPFHISKSLQEVQRMLYGESWLPDPVLSVLLAGDSLGEEGKYFVLWSLEELTAWGKHSYRKRDNVFVPILTDGTNIEGIVFEESCISGLKGEVVKGVFANTAYFRLYATAYRLTNDEFMWEMARDIALGNHLGDIGGVSGEGLKIPIHTPNSDPCVLLGFLELYEATKKKEFLSMAKDVADNIVENKLHRGFFVLSKEHFYSRFDCFEPLALLHLVAKINNSELPMPPVWPTYSLFSHNLRFEIWGSDRWHIYQRTDSPEVPWSLQDAAHIGDINKVKTLLDSGVGVDSWSGHSATTALQHAALTGHTAVGELLLTNGADVNYRSINWPFTPLNKAVRYGHKEFVELLLKYKVDVNLRDNWGRGQAPLDIACDNNHKDIAELLVAHGAKIPNLYSAVQLGDLGRVKAFLEQGLDINAKDKDGRTALHIAVSNKGIEVAKLLIEKGANVDTKNNKGYTPLYSAIWNNDPNMVDLLVRNGADVNYTPEKDYPPLHYAVWWDNMDIAKLLVTHGANCDVKDRDGWTAFRYAVNSANKEMVDLFIAKGADVSGIHRAACLGDLARVKSFLKQGTDVDVTDEFGWTPLYWAASMGQEEVGEFLLNKGAQATFKTKDEVTPLHQAAKIGASGLVKLLISKGADVKGRDKWGNTPLHNAMPRAHKDVVELFLENGADINAQNNRGRTPLDLAVFQRNDEVVNLAVKHDLESTNPPEPIHDVGVANVAVTSYCTHGDVVVVTASVANQGTFRESVTVTLNDQTNSRKVATKTSMLGKKWEGKADDLPDLVFLGETPKVDRFGNRTCIGGDVNGDGHSDILVCSGKWNEDRGRAYLFFGGPKMDTRADVIFSGENPHDSLGNQSGFFADLNNDGLDDLIIGVPGRTWTSGHDGQVNIYYGSPQIDDVPHVVLKGTVGSQEHLGLMVTAGDIDNDGYVDVLAGAQGYDNLRGRVYLFWGGEPLDARPDVVFEGKDPNSLFGRRIDAGGDVNGDGYNDIVVGARQAGVERYSGAAYLYFGNSKKEMDSECDWIFKGQEKGDQMGSSVDIFDIDADGYADVLVGARFAGNGRVYIYWGDKDFDGTTPGLVLEAPTLSSMGGDYIDCGYFNDDRYGDIIAGGFGYPGTSYWYGRAYLFYGNERGLMDTTHDYIFGSSCEIDSFLCAVSVGDVNSDGYTDALIGEPGYRDHLGRASLHYGPFHDTTNITFNWDTTNASIGKHTLKVEIPPVPEEKNTEDNVKTVTIEVKEK
jgi:pectate lyase